ncbi:unnamed protein product [Adineta ricciae]|uniref:G-protein coupled receptors family 1 profile domain-containing protein n=1 Tax=Adineta ricciae TaxID=249248 RepID=A0A814DWI4_ADIRI|nr:unnamed protein product [Adineta ricciae]CAF1479756.1 unnamed protein product [Adineta ricciae]
MFKLQGMLQHQVNMYDTAHGLDKYCLLYYVRKDIVDYEEPFILTHQRIPYCIRLLNESILDEDISIDNTIHNGLKYEIYLNNMDESSSFENDILFYNCSSPWFGPRCSFAFDLENDRSLDEVVLLHFYNKPMITNGSIITCYEHLKCTWTSLLCLDWREICDRKMDCLDGSDELHCWQLEINECSANEYRCHNGQCIPKEFFHDIQLNPDCLDRTDESIRNDDYPDFCSRDPSFRCEEHTCRPGKTEYPCGDGQCTAEMDTRFGAGCQNGRHNPLLNNLCSYAMACLMHMDVPWCDGFCTDTNCTLKHCPDVYEFPLGPILFGHVRLMFQNAEREIESSEVLLPNYVCYNENLCRDFLPFTVQFNGSTCRYFHQLGFDETSYSDPEDLVRDIKERFRPCLVTSISETNCHHSVMYRCFNSTKCISKYRLVDGINDCPFDDDETFNQDCSFDDSLYRFECFRDGKRKCLAPLIIGDGKRDCERAEDERNENDGTIESHISFQTICDGKTELSPLLIDGRYETDETHCEDWPCNNTYTRCDRFWLCKNGTDEINCPSSLCPENQYDCVLFNDTSKLTCISASKINDGTIDCLGASDERNICLRKTPLLVMYYFHCSIDSKCIHYNGLCDRNATCSQGDDEKFCRNYGSRRNPLCSSNVINRTDVENFLCHSLDGPVLPRIVYFKLQNRPNYLLELTADREPRKLQSDSFDGWQCNRGLSVYKRMSSNQSELHCLCPPAYYGDRCQYQNQRVSLTIQIQAVSDWRTTFVLVMRLIDDEQKLESYDFIEYLPIRDCQTKYNSYLLYSSRPKDLLRNYSVQIDVFNKLTLTHRSSWLFPVKFSFLPVYRLSVLLTIPIFNSNPRHTVVHGRCFYYINQPNSTFCLCDFGWSGSHCSIEQKCSCAKPSLCINGSICVCPLDRYGARCYLRRSPCNSCSNNGQCVLDDSRYSLSKHRSTCLCLKEYFGDHCEHRQTQIDVSFDDHLQLPFSLIIHLITVQNQAKHIRTSLMRKIGINQELISFYTSITFNIALAEFDQNYYLILLRDRAFFSTILSAKIRQSHRCKSLTELFNQTFINQHLLKRIKFYHRPCQNQRDLICFYDSVHICLCDVNRNANCFEFNHHMAYNCHIGNLCENEGLCYYDNSSCPTTPICVCPDCYYGSRCQFSTRGTSLSLDTILGYHIQPSVRMSQQSAAVKLSMGITCILFCFGLVNSLFSLLTFRTKPCHDVGCGLYLFSSSIVSMVLTIVLAMKYVHLLILQMKLIGNRRFEYMQCLVTDFLLRVLVSSNDWLIGCVAIERSLNIYKGVHFNKNRSRQVAKRAISLVFLLTVLTHMHDPWHRHTIDDEEDQRSLCLCQYSRPLQIYDWIINIIHFAFPFLINFISALMIIIISARNRSNIQRKKPRKTVLHEQFQQHKHLLISPIVLILLAVPRLIISFVSKCMKSAREPWLYLIGYYISFIPSMLNFVIFVLPSNTYRTQFDHSIRNLWRS